MRTSRVSKDSARISQALSPVCRSFPPLPLNETQRSPADSAPPKEEYPSSDGSSLSSVDTMDMEDIVDRPVKRRKANPAATKRPRRTVSAKKATDEPKNQTRRGGKHPSASLGTTPPANWDRIYDTVKNMRIKNPTAPVDTVGCSELYWRGSSVRKGRLHILVALMLSSQTKDTVTALAMQRLHTELGTPDAEPLVVKAETEDDSKLANFKDSTLTLENILAVSPERLNELIRAVGFHNNKTKYIKAVAPILRDKHDSDIPSTVKDLMALPGVGPKMAYLCMSAAWGKHEGIGVDVHVHRITNLWGWQKTKNPEETRAALESWLPRDKWYEINKLLVGLGQTVCLPVGRRCGECDLSGSGLCMGEIKGVDPKKKKRAMAKKEELDDTASSNGS